MSNLTILKTAISQIDNLFSLNDLHRISGNQAKHQPNRFIRLETTGELVAEIQKEDPSTIAVKSLRGTQGGTYACEELALAYAMWISPKFHLVVLRAFIAMHKGEVKNQQLALPEPEKTYTFDFTEYELQLMLWGWFSEYKTNNLLDELIEPLEVLGSRFAPRIYSHKKEYAHSIEASAEIIYRLTKDFHDSKDSNWQTPLFSLRGVMFHQEQMRKKHEAKVKKAQARQITYTEF